MKLITRLYNYQCKLKQKPSRTKGVYLIAASRHCSATSSKIQIAILLSSGVLSLPCIQNISQKIKNYDICVLVLENQALTLIRHNACMKST